MTGFLRALAERVAGEPHEWHAHVPARFEAVQAIALEDHEQVAGDAPPPVLVLEPPPATAPAAAATRDATRASAVAERPRPSRWTTCRRRSAAAMEGTAPTPAADPLPEQRPLRRATDARPPRPPAGRARDARRHRGEAERGPVAPPSVAWPAPDAGAGVDRRSGGPSGRAGGGSIAGTTAGTAIDPDPADAGHPAPIARSTGRRSPGPGDAGADPRAHRPRRRAGGDGSRARRTRGPRAGAAPRSRPRGVPRQHRTAGAMSERVFERATQQTRSSAHWCTSTSLRVSDRSMVHQ